MMITSQGWRLLALPDQRATRRRSSITSCGTGSGRKLRTARSPSRNAMRSLASALSAIAQLLPPTRFSTTRSSGRPRLHLSQRHLPDHHSSFPRPPPFFSLRSSFFVLRDLCVLCVFAVQIVPFFVLCVIFVSSCF